MAAEMSTEFITPGEMADRWLEDAVDTGIVRSGKGPEAEQAWLDAWAGAQAWTERDHALSPISDDISLYQATVGGGSEVELLGYAESMYTSVELSDDAPNWPGTYISPGIRSAARSTYGEVVSEYELAQREASLGQVASMAAQLLVARGGEL
jgi:hypothetical protein